MSEGQHLLEVTAVVIWHYMNKSELNLLQMISVVAQFCCPKQCNRCSPSALLARFAFVLFPKVKIELDFHETGQQHFQEAKNLKIAKELEVEQRLMTNRIWFAFFFPPSGVQKLFE